jgi:hypothetical protein
MIIIRRLLGGLRTLVAPGRAERELDDELLAYLGARRLRRSVR